MLGFAGTDESSTFRHLWGLISSMGQRSAATVACQIPKLVPNLKVEETPCLGMAETFSRTARRTSKEFGSFKRLLRSMAQRDAGSPG